MNTLRGNQSDPDNKSADRLFRAGRFQQAEALYAKTLAEDPGNRHAAIRLAAIALLCNRLTDVQAWSTRAIELDSRTPTARLGLHRFVSALLRPKDASPQGLLGQAYYLGGNYRLAAPLLRAAGWKAQARKLKSFGDGEPYQIEGQAEVVRQAFIVTDPLPVVHVTINGGTPVNFFIDTGGAELIIDSEFAAESGVDLFDNETGVFGGGKRADYRNGRVDSVALGGMVVRNVPVSVMNVRRFSQPIFDGRRVDGIIGTFFLYQFLSTLDYARGELVLRRKTAEHFARLEFELREQNPVIVPFWMAEHCMLAWGTVNKIHPLLLFVDTGLAGMGFTCPKSTVDQAGLILQKHLAGEGLGGGGKVASIPLVVDHLALGNAGEETIQGAFGPFPPQLENAFGFRIGGLISHQFFRPYALTIDFTGMRYFLTRQPGSGL